MKIKCTICSYEGKHEVITKGYFFVELFLWIIFFPIGIIYSIWRLCSRYNACPMCKNDHVIPFDFFKRTQDNLKKAS